MHLQWQPWSFLLQTEVVVRVCEHLMRIGNKRVIPASWLATHSNHHCLLFIFEVLVDIFILYIHRVFVLHFFVFAIGRPSNYGLPTAVRLLINLVIHPLSRCLVSLLFLKGLLHVALVCNHVEFIVRDSTLVHLVTFVSGGCCFLGANILLQLLQRLSERCEGVIELRKVRRKVFFAHELFELHAGLNWITFYWNC